jgi:hypothetical protein
MQTPSAQVQDRGCAPAAGSGDRAPPLVRRIGLALLVALLGGAGWLIAVRGEAILVDLATLGGRVWCF